MVTGSKDDDCPDANGNSTGAFQSVMDRWKKQDSGFNPIALGRNKNAASTPVVRRSGRHVPAPSNEAPSHQGTEPPAKPQFSLKTKEAEQPTPTTPNQGRSNATKSTRSDAARLGVSCHKEETTKDSLPSARVKPTRAKSFDDSIGSKSGSSKDKSRKGLGNKDKSSNKSAATVEKKSKAKDAKSSIDNSKKGLRASSTKLQKSEEVKDAEQNDIDMREQRKRLASSCTAKIRSAVKMLALLSKTRDQARAELRASTGKVRLALLRQQDFVYQESTSSRNLPSNQDDLPKQQHDMSDKALDDSSNASASDGEVQCPSNVEDLQYQCILGEGQFGQVWLVTANTGRTKKSEPFALKIQSKHQLVEENKAFAVAQEAAVLTHLGRRSGIIHQVRTYQNDDFIFQLMRLVPGGELFSVMYRDDNIEGIPERHAMFYAFGVADALAYIHRRHCIYRDLKPENVLIDERGYPVLVDFGFAKILPKHGKTYTLLGTPGYVAPEVIQLSGHSFGIDHWALGILVYEMIVGENPFYFHGIDQGALYESILHDTYEPMPSSKASPQAIDFVARLLMKDPTQRIGFGIEKEIKAHEWLRSIDRKLYRKKGVGPPWLPTLAHPLDSSNFEDFSESTNITKSEITGKLSASIQKIFENF
jgi:Protein kinase domain